MTTYTQAKLAEDVLRDLGVVGAADSALGDDVTFVIRRLTAKLEELADRQAVDWDITGAIPASRYDALLQIMLPIVGPSYGVPVPDQVGAMGRATLFKMVRGDYREGEPKDY